MLDSIETPIDRTCEDCGGLVVSAPEPFAPGDDPELEAEGQTAAVSEWCTNLDCPSNHALKGLTRAGVNDYICTVCGEALRTPMSAVRAHRNALICRDERVPDDFERAGWSVPACDL